MQCGVARLALSNVGSDVRRRVMSVGPTEIPVINGVQTTKRRERNRRNMVS